MPTKSNAYTRPDIDTLIKELLDRGGFTPEERLRKCQETIDIAILRAHEIAESGDQKGALTWPSVAERMQAVLANIVAMQTTSDKTATINVFFKPADEENDNGYTVELRESVGPDQAVPETATVPVD